MNETLNLQFSIGAHHVCVKCMERQHPAELCAVCGSALVDLGSTMLPDAAFRTIQDTVVASFHTPRATERTRLFEARTQPPSPWLMRSVCLILMLVCAAWLAHKSEAIKSVEIAQHIARVTQKTPPTIPTWTPTACGVLAGLVLGRVLTALIPVMRLLAGMLSGVVTAILFALGQLSALVAGIFSSSRRRTIERITDQLTRPLSRMSQAIAGRTRRERTGLRFTHPVSSKSTIVPAGSLAPRPANTVVADEDNGKLTGVIETSLAPVGLASDLSGVIVLAQGVQRGVRLRDARVGKFTMRSNTGETVEVTAQTGTLIVHEAIVRNARTVFLGDGALPEWGVLRRTELGEFALFEAVSPTDQVHVAQIELHAHVSIHGGERREIIRVDLHGETQTVIECSGTAERPIVIEVLEEQAA